MNGTVSVIRVGLVGAECSGKTTLAAALARSFGVPWVPELLREFCEQQGRTPRRDEQRDLMREQIRRESLALTQARDAGAPFLICDSTPLVTALYSQELFADRSLIVEARAHQPVYQATLLTDIDLAWQADGIQRDGETARRLFDASLRESLRAFRIAHTRVCGEPQRRLALARETLLALRADPIAYNQGSR
jgi:nicotinamide riboside kinase